MTLLTAAARGAAFGVAVTGLLMVTASALLIQPIGVGVGICGIYWGRRWWRQLAPRPAGRRRRTEPVVGYPGPLAEAKPLPPDPGRPLRRV